MAAEAEAGLSTAHANGTNSEANGAAGQGKLTAAQKRRARLKKGKAAKQAVRSASKSACNCAHCHYAARTASACMGTYDNLLRTMCRQASQKPADADSGAQVGSLVCFTAVVECVAGAVVRAVRTCKAAHILVTFCSAQPSSLGAEVEYVSAPREYEAFVASAGPEATEEPADSSECTRPTCGQGHG